MIIEIPQKAPKGAVTRKDETTFMFLERVKNTTLRWVKPGHTNGQNTHNVSATVFINKNEWDEVGEWMWLNRYFYNGLACFPFDDTMYPQPPFETCSKETYDNLMKELTLVDLTQIVELDDDNNFGQEPACAGGICEI
jgi:ribonucleoside-diphosphate reductase alpha chain